MHHTIKTGLLQGSGGLLILSLLLTACSGETPATGKRPASNVPPAQLVELATVSTDVLGHTSQRTGTLRARRTIRIFNQEEGSLTAMPFYEGARVRKGDLLVKIDDKLLRAQLDKASATRQQADQDMARLQTLRKKRLVSENDLTRARTALNVASAEERLLQTRLGYTSLRAPIDGIISARLAEPGDVAPRHTHLLTLIDTSTLITEVAVSELILPNLNEGDTVEIRIDALGAQTFNGKILRIHPTLNEATRTGIIEIVLDPPPANARPGQLCRVNLRSQQQRRMMIPFSALRSDNQGEHVYVVNADNKARRVAVTTGLRTDDRIEIINGLEHGQQVVIKGFLGLKHGKTVRTAGNSGQG